MASSWHAAGTPSYIRMMVYDLIVRNGTIVDGLGGEPTWAMSRSPMA